MLVFAAERGQPAERVHIPLIGGRGALAHHRSAGVGRLGTPVGRHTPVLGHGAGCGFARRGLRGFVLHGDRSPDGELLRWICRLRAIDSAVNP